MRTGVITVLLKRVYASAYSCVLNPIPSFWRPNRLEVARKAINISSLALSTHALYFSEKSSVDNVSMSGACSLSGENDNRMRPAFSLPVNFSVKYFSISCFYSSSGTPLLRLISALLENPLEIPFNQYSFTFDSVRAALIAEFHKGNGYTPLLFLL